MRKELKNYAFIDAQNLNLSIRHQGWSLDWKKFRVYLTEKYGVSVAYVFIGYVSGNENLYRSLQKNGYICIFKETLELPDGRVKGNVDAELVLQAMIDKDEYHKAIIISGDGDFACIVRYFREQGKLERLLIPDKNHYSALLKKAAEKHIAYINDLKNKLQYTQKKNPI